MTPKEKAEEIVGWYVDLLRQTDRCTADRCESPLQCQLSPYRCKGWLDYGKGEALEEVDEMISFLKMDADLNEDMRLANSDLLDYLAGVKREIDEL